MNIVQVCRPMGTTSHLDHMTYAIIAAHVPFAAHFKLGATLGVIL